jgi:hypothetical protein
LSGWWFFATPLKKYGFVSWDDEIPNMMGKMKLMFQTTNQLVRFLELLQAPVFGKTYHYFQTEVGNFPRMMTTC